MTPEQKAEYITIVSSVTLKRMLWELWALTDEDLYTLYDAIDSERQPSARARSAAKRAKRAE
jgi:hypothetical protein